MVVRVETCGAWPRMLAGLAGDQTAGTADKREAGDGDDADEGEIAGIQPPAVPGVRQPRAVLQHRTRRGTGVALSPRRGWAERAGQPASTAKNASQAARKRAPRGATAKDLDRRW